MQTFLRASDDQFKKDFGNKKQLAPTDLLHKYKEVFPKEAEMELTEEVSASVDKYFENLKRTIEFYKTFVRIGGWLNKLKKRNTLDYLTFIKHALGDFKRTLPVEAQERILGKYDTFVRLAHSGGPLQSGRAQRLQHQAQRAAHRVPVFDGPEGKRQSHREAAARNAQKANGDKQRNHQSESCRRRNGQERHVRQDEQDGQDKRTRGPDEPGTPGLTRPPRTSTPSSTSSLSWRICSTPRSFPGSW